MLPLRACTQKNNGYNDYSTNIENKHGLCVFLFAMRKCTDMELTTPPVWMQRAAQTITGGTCNG